MSGEYMQYLICKITDKDGAIDFVVYDSDKKAVSYYSQHDMMGLVVKRSIVNAKLENSVIKITDSKKALAKLSYEEGKVSSVYYCFYSYTSPLGNNVYALVSNIGRVVEMSSSMAAEFFAAHRVINATCTKKGEVHVIDVPAFSSVLRQSLEHVNIR
jgi:hypothetical protein